MGVGFGGTSGEGLGVGGTPGSSSAEAVLRTGPERKHSTKTALPISAPRGFSFKKIGEDKISPPNLDLSGGL